MVQSDDVSAVNLASTSGSVFRHPAAVEAGSQPENRATGRRYRIQLEALDGESRRELQRCLRDLDHEKQVAVQQARLQPRRR